MKVLHLLTFYLQTIWEEEKSVSKGKEAFISTEVIPKGLYSRKKIGTYEVQRQQIYFCLLVDGVGARDDLYSADPLVSRAFFGWLGGNIMPFLHTEECQTFRWWLHQKRKQLSYYILYKSQQKSCGTFFEGRIVSFSLITLFSTQKRRSRRGFLAGRAISFGIPLLFQILFSFLFLQCHSMLLQWQTGN